MTMTRQEFILAAVLAVNLLAAVLYLLWGILFVTAKKRKKETGNMCGNRRVYLLRALVMVLCPVVGPLFFLFSYLLYLTVFRFQVDLEDVIFHKDRVRTQIRADEERERNLIPVEEAVIVNDKRSLRMAMMNIIKGDMQGSLSSIALALDTEDSETAHYAASALSDILNEFRSSVHKMVREIQEEADGETAAKERLLDYMDGVLKQGVFTKAEQNRFVGMMEHTAELLYEKASNRLTAKQYESVCLRLLETGAVENSRKWCLRLKEQYPQQLVAFTCLLKLYFTAREREAFFETLDELKRSEVGIDSETLEMIRVFS